MREHLGGYQALGELGLDFVVAEANIRFRRPLHFDEWFEVKVTVGAFTSRSLSLEFELTREGTPITDISISYVCIETESRSPHLLPDNFRSRLEDEGP